MPIVKSTAPDQRGPRVILKPGEYDFVVVDAKASKAKNSGNDMIELKLKVGPDEVTVFDNLVFTANAMWKINQFLFTTELVKSEGESINLVAEDCLALTGVCRIRTGKDNNGNPRNEVESYCVEEF